MDKCPFDFAHPAYKRNHERFFPSKEVRCPIYKELPESMGRMHTKAVSHFEETASQITGKGAAYAAIGAPHYTAIGFRKLVGLLGLA
jgi:hypothetical protein